MDDLKRVYRHAMPGRIAELEKARSVEPASAAADAVRRIAHSLRGSGATYGFPDVSRAAAAVEDAAPRDLHERLDALLLVLRDTARPDDADA